MKSAKDIRTSLSLTQAEIARAADVAARTVRDFEAGRLAPSLRTRRKLALAYRITLEQFDTLTRGEAVEWCLPPAMPVVGGDHARLQRDAKLLIDRKMFAPDGELRRLFNESEASDVIARGIVAPWVRDLADGKFTADVLSRLQAADQSLVA